MKARSFEKIRLPLFSGNQGCTSAAGLRASSANDNATRLRTFGLRTMRLAGRFALTQLRSVVKPGRAIPTTFRTQCRLVVQFGPSLAFVSSTASPSFVKTRHRWPLRFEDHSNTDGCRGADKCWSETDNAERC